MTISMVLVASALVGCSSDDTPENAQKVEMRENAVTVEMTEYSYATRGQIVAGDATVEVDNRGTEAHTVRFGRLRAGKTLDDVRSALTTKDPEALRDVFSQQLGVPGGAVTPGTRYRVTTPVFDQAAYAMYCTFVGTDGSPHFAKGMMSMFEVAQGQFIAEPQADATYSLADERIEGPSTLKAGEVRLRVRAARAGPHDLVVARRREGAGLQETELAVRELFGGNRAPDSIAALPFTELLRVFDVDPGTSAWVTLSLAPGDYFVGCLRPPAFGDRPSVSPESHSEILEVKVS